MAEDHLKRSASFASIRRDEPSFEEDPLVELARIVAEDGGFYRQGSTPELRPARNEPTHRETYFAEDAPSREEALANQLEAELMQNLDLSSLRSDVPPQQPETELPAVGGAPEDQPGDEPLRPAGGGEDLQDRQPSHIPDIVIEDARPPTAAPARWQDRAPSADDHGAFQSADPGFGAAPGPRAGQWRDAEREAPEGSAEWLEGDLQDSYAGLEPVEASGARQSGFDAAGEGSAVMVDTAYAEPHSADQDYSDAYADDFEAEQDEIERRPERPMPVRGRRSRKGLLAAAGVLGIVVLGGAVTAIIGAGGPANDGAPPPVIRADAGPAKVAAEGTDQPEAGSGAGQAVYDRVAGRVPKSDEKLIDRAEEPRQVSRVVLPQADPAADQAGGRSAVGDLASDGSAASTQRDGGSSDGGISGQISSETPAMQSGPRIDPVGPRRVRTVTVRPDGTIVSTPTPVRVAEASAQPSREVETDFGGEAPEPVAVRTVPVKTGESPSGPLAGQAAAAEPDSAVTPQPLAPAAESRPAETTDRNAAAGTERAENQDAAEAPAPEGMQLAMLPRARPDQVPTAFVDRTAAPSRESPPAAAAQSGASSRGGQPVNLLAAGPASPRAQAQPAQPEREAAASAGSPYAVQLSAQRSEEQARAAFAGLRNNFPSVLGRHQPEIERADLGERGIFYRVRVGTQTQAEAIQLCEQLKAAGGNCFVTR